MRGVSRLIDGLSKGDPTAMSVLIFTVVGTIVIVSVTMIIKKNRDKK